MGQGGKFGYGYLKYPKSLNLKHMDLGMANNIPIIRITEIL